MAPKTITLPLLSITYLSPLCDPLRKAGIEPGFLLWLYGMSGTLKSTLAALCLSHFGDFDNKHLPASFRDSMASMEKRLFAAKDSLIVVDDFHPASDTNEARKMEGIAQLLLRAYGDRVGRGRANPNTSLKPDYPPRGMAVATGEQLPSGLSSMARLFVLEIKKGDVDLPALTTAQATQDKLSRAMTGYIMWLAPQLDTLPGELKSTFQQLRAAAMTEEQHLRVPEAVAWLYLGWAFFLDFARSTGAITEAQLREFSEEGWKVLIDLAAAQEQRIIAERPVTKFITLLQEMFSQHAIYVKGVDGGQPPNAEAFGWELDLVEGEKNFYPGRTATFLGWSDGAFLYLLPEATYKEVARFSSSQGAMFPVKPQTLWKHLEAEGLIEVERDRDRTYRTVRPPKKVQGAPLRVLKLDVHKIFQG